MYGYLGVTTRSSFASITAFFSFLGERLFESVCWTHLSREILKVEFTFNRVLVCLFALSRCRIGRLR